MKHSQTINNIFNPYIQTTILSFIPSFSTWLLLAILSFSSLKHEFFIIIATSVFLNFSFYCLYAKTCWYIACDGKGKRKVKVNISVYYTLLPFSLLFSMFLWPFFHSFSYSFHFLEFYFSFFALLELLFFLCSSLI